MRVAEIEEWRAVGIGKVALAILGLDKSVLVDIKIARILLAGNASAAMM